jgi:uncharacterized membrane protein (DUF373 family)
MLVLKLPDTQLIFRKALQYIVKVLIFFIILVLSVGLVKTISGIKTLMGTQSIGQAFNSIVTDVLSFLVIIELFRSFIDYFEVHRFRLHAMVDPAIVFVMRELIVKLYNQSDINWQTLLVFGFLILCLGIVRALAVCFSPGEDEFSKNS